MLALWLVLIRTAAAAPAPRPPAPQAALRRGNAYYFAGRQVPALRAYERATALSSACLQGWL
ncbi:MAG: hypothetical protein KGK30_08375, partial [Elusimicrobia bacterium]|nr:hypothetical protein [Elusimicrobiota bacterium]